MLLAQDGVGLAVLDEDVDLAELAHLAGGVLDGLRHVESFRKPQPHVRGFGSVGKGERDDQ